MPNLNFCHYKSEGMSNYRNNYIPRKGDTYNNSLKHVRGTIIKIRTYVEGPPYFVIQRHRVRVR